MIPFSYIVSSAALSFTSRNGAPVMVPSTHPSYGEIKDMLPSIRTSDDLLRASIEHLADIPSMIYRSSEGTIEVTPEGVLYKGEIVTHVLAKKMVQALVEKKPITAFAKFFENLMENTSYQAVQQLYGFMERSGLGITEDGYLLAYKKVKADYTDCRTGTFDNSVGSIVEMPRNRVDDDPTKDCSSGLHFCAYHYLSTFPGEIIVVLKINPRDVVCVPDVCGNKGRACRYEVVGSLERETPDVLSEKAVH